MTNPLRASIIIPTYNRSEILSYTLESILRQSIDLNEIEVIVADDGSSDDTKEVVLRYQSKLKLKYVRQEDQGYRAGAARNLGIRSAESPVCIFLDNGILLSSRAIEAHLNVHEQSEEACTVIGYIYGFDDDNVHNEELYRLVDYNNPDESIRLLQEQGILDNREPLYRELGDDLSKWPAPWVIFWSGNISVKTEVLFRVGLFDEYYTTWGGEDTDLGLALEKHHVRFVLSRQADSIHYPHKKDSTWQVDPEERERDFERKRDYMHSKYNTEATKLWYTCYYNELNQKLLALRQDHLIGQG
ncbi:glycosyltransferase [Paenibacillus aquistagni]|uniref:Glycosyltransferase, GT2 family n=1 Tax=Paenibacillus aquistagni TaxID=1852522 RepID=A0A1X7LQ20_9BACL|nr:glycosyltransferase [Paenibacillus aquistagni]SMG55403.1 Glycosyltransferase, GT2 family [Paenibacillus aquistagni]